MATGGTEGILAPKKFFVRVARAKLKLEFLPPEGRQANSSLSSLFLALIGMERGEKLPGTLSTGANFPIRFLVETPPTARRKLNRYAQNPEKRTLSEESNHVFWAAIRMY